MKPLNTIGNFFAEGKKAKKEAKSLTGLIDQREKEVAIARRWVKHLFLGTDLNLNGLTPVKQNQT
jgi:hypothetical protein